MLYHSKKILAFTLIASLSFIGCSKNIPNLGGTKEYSLPSWYLNAPSNSNVFIYGAAEGSSLEEAKINALNNMSSRLMVSVSSSLEQRKTSSTLGGYSKDISQEINVETEKIKFTNVQVEKNAVLNENFYVLLKVNRPKLFEEKKKEFDLEDQKLSKLYSSLDSYAKYERVIKLQNNYKEIKNNKKQSFILYAINNSFDYGQYFNKYDSYIDRLNKEKDNIKISVNSNEKKSYFKDELVELLNSNNFKVSKNSISDVKIKIDNKVRYSIARGWQIAKISTTLKVILNNKIMSNKTLNTIGRSSSSKENALQNAAMQFKEQVNEEGLNKLIFKN